MCYSVILDFHVATYTEVLQRQSDYQPLKLAGPEPKASEPWYTCHLADSISSTAAILPAVPSEMNMEALGDFHESSITEKLELNHVPPAKITVHLLPGIVVSI